jgi:hypothetical protein
VTLATDIATKWGAELMPNFQSVWTLNEVDVLDIATDTGLSGQWTGAIPGTASGSGLPANCAINIEFGIARRYRGGKPRMYLPPSIDENTASDTHWNATVVNNIAAAVQATMSYIEGLSVGSMGTLQHVNLSYYDGFTNITNSSGRTRAVPKYRTAALVDTVTGYFGKTLIASQRRRRTATTP